jgi:hypothetical protein
MDLADAATAPFTPTDHHRRLEQLVGAWRGTARTSYGPNHPPESAAWEATLALLLGGRFLRATYTSSAMGSAIAGELTIGYSSSERRWTMSWIDSFHTSPAILSSQGEAGDLQLRASGDYFAGEGQPRWGWRTEIDESEAPARLRIVMTNIKPGGEESPAVEIDLERSSP